MVKHVVVDLETLSSRSDACVVSIGAVVFDHETRPSIAEVFDHGATSIRERRSAVWPGNARAFYSNVRESSGHVDQRTIRWWLEQSEDARAALLGPSLPEAEALQVFATWLSFHGGRDFRVWAHATFDQPILGNAYERHRLDLWPYRSSRDLRTIFEHAGVTGHEPDLTDEPLVLHHALHDAYREALALERAMNTVGWPN